MCDNTAVKLNFINPNDTGMYPILWQATAYVYGRHLTVKIKKNGYKPSYKDITVLLASGFELFKSENQKRKFENKMRVLVAANLPFEGKDWYFNLL